MLHSNVGDSQSPTAADHHERPSHNARRVDVDAAGRPASSAAAAGDTVHHSAGVAVAAELGCYAADAARRSADTSKRK